MSRFPRDDYRALVPYTPDRRPISVDLSDNTNLWGTHPAALEAVRNAPPEGLIRYPSVYADLLKDAAGARFRIPRECVTTGCGSDDLLDSAFRAAAEPPGLVSYPAPTFSMVEIFARMNGLTAAPKPLRDVLADPELLMEDDPSIVYLCSPNNPTGEALPRDWMLALLEMLGEDGPLVIVDEAYVDFGGESLLGDATTQSRLLILRTLSKAFGLAGLRVGIGIGSPAVIAEIEKSRGPYKVSRLAERGAVAALEDRDGWVPEVVSEVKENRKRLSDELERRGLDPLPSEANFILVPLRNGDLDVVTRELRARGVAVRPFPEVEGVGDALRVTIGPWHLMEQFLEALDEMLDKTLLRKLGQPR